MFHSLVYCLVACATNAQADAKSDLLSEIETLKSRLEKLEGSSGSAVAAAESDIKISGTVDTIYSYNFNRPGSAANVARVFDNDSDSFSLNAAKLTVQQAVGASDPAGFRIDILAGNDAELIHSSGLGQSSDSFDLEQAYAEFNLGLSKLNSSFNDVNLKVGKFVTLAGAEVIESKDNWNTSRGLLFGYAIPFTHTGMRATYAFDNGWDMALGVNNGWDVTDDTNTSKTLEAHLGFNGIALPGDSSLTVTMQGYFGKEETSEAGGQRKVLDLVAIYKTSWKPLTFMYNYDYGQQDDAFASGEKAKWSGHAGYIRFDLNADWSLIGRGEYFDDADGFRIAGTEAKYREFTGTLEYRPWKGVITRVEYRKDHADQDVFNDEDGMKDSQDTLSGEFIYSF